MTKHLTIRLSLLLLLLFHTATVRAWSVTAVADANVAHAYLNNVASGSIAETKTDVTAIKLSKYYTRILADLGLKENASGQSLYIRWYIENADGTLANIDGKLTPATTAKGHITDTQCLYWCSTLTTTPFNSANSAAILDLNYANAGTVGQKVVALIAKIDNTNPLTTANGAVTAEPAKFQLKYSFRLVDQTNARACYITTDASHLTANQVNFNYKKNTTSFELPAVNKDDRQFSRWYLVDRATGQMIENSQDYMAPVKVDAWPTEGAYYKTPQGMTVYSRWDAVRFPPDMRITLPAGKTFSDIKVVCLYSNNVNGLVFGNSKNVNYKYPDYFVAQDPEAWTSVTEYTFTYYSPVDFKHSSGYAYNYAPEGLKDGRQQVAQWTYQYYVKPGEKCKLFVPVFKHDTNGNEQEPNAYWRWYDNDTDRGSAYLSTDDNTGNMLYNINNSGSDFGLFCYKMDTEMPNDNNVSAVWFNTPAADAGWTGSDIACDVSRYVDNQSPTDDILCEPTLSMRYIFNVRPATEIAGNIKKAILNGKAYEDNGHLTIGLFEGYKGNLTLRLNIRDLSMYYFYPYNNNDFGTQAKESDFGTTLCQGQTVTWTAITRIGSQYYYHILTQGDGKEAALLNTDNVSINASSFLGDYKPVIKPSSSADATKTLSTIKIGTPYYVVAFVNDYSKSGDSNGHSTPVASYNLYFRAESAPQDLNNLDYNRTDSLLEAKYTKVAEISFDDEEGMNFNKPKQAFTKGDAYNNQWDKPVEWTRSNYSFTYPGLRDYSYYRHTFGAGQYYITPLHSDYALLKSINDNPASQSNTTSGYYWYTKKTLYDATYYKSGHTKYGYFAYVDASDEARPVISADFDANLCEGSTVVATIAVANVTNVGSKDNSYPQLTFKIYGEGVNQSTGQTERRLIQSFASGDFKSVNATAEAQWYQIFASSILASGTHPEKYSHFVITIDNQGASTQGNDFAIDDIRIYVKNPKIEVLQQSDDADICKNRENGAKLRLTMVYGQVKDALELPNYTDVTTDITRPLFWRLVHADTGLPVNTAYGDSTYNAGHTHDYGAIVVHSTDTLNRRNLYVDANEYYHLMLADRFFKLDPHKQYYVSIATPRRRIVNGVEVYEPSSWGTPNATCSIYSEPQDYVQQDAVVTDENGSVSTTFSAECGATTVMVQMKGRLSLPDGVNGGRIEVSRWPFDWFSGSAAEFQAVSGLNTALVNFRAEYPDSHTLQPTKGCYTKADSTLLHQYVQGVPSNSINEYEQKLYLLASNTFKAPFDLPADGNRVVKITLIPLAGQYTDTRTMPVQHFTICGYPLETSATLTHDGPVLNLGFPSVTYPDEWAHTARYLRLDLNQVAALKTDGKYLRVPIHSYADAQRPISTKLHNLQLVTYNAGTAPAQLILSATNDPLNTANIGKSFGTVQNAIIQPTTRNLSFNLAPAKAAGIELHEGYDYTLEMQYYDVTQDPGSANTCKGTTYITLQVIPEYVTWTNQLANNDNWNNDANWRRASKAELYSTTYKDYGTDIPGLQQTAGSDAGSTPHAFIPLRTTKVIVPTGGEPPFLGSYSVATRDSLLTYLDNAVNAPATTNIAYYLVLNDKPVASATGTYYDCVRFYANTCDQVYFKPRAELRYQQYLQYNQAWVDVEMQPGEWTMWSSPLKSVYAGDFYVPQATGRQLTEAFKPITYNAAVNSRAGYPIYQRSWDKAQSMVITDSDDALRKDYYDAYIDYDSFSGTDTLAVMQQWSSRYNDVTVPYAPGRGAALLSEDKPLTGQPTLVRLPKADTQYAYYRADGTERQTVPLPARTGQGQLATSDPAVGDPQKLTGRLVISIDEANEHQDNGYYLVGNPYMSSLYMKRFFDQNTQLYPKYWTMQNGQMCAFDASADNVVAPMTAFFVKPVSGTLLQNIEFLPIMTVPFTSAVKQSAEATLRLTLTSGSHTTSASIVADKGAADDFKEGEDVEAMFDSNTTGSALTLYTMAGQLAAAINHVPDLCNVPLGIVAPATSAVTLRIAGTDQLRKPLYLYDAHTKHYTLLTDSTAVTLTPNAVGRYALTSQAIAPQPVQTALRCWASQGGMVTATTAPDDCLRTVLVFDPTGRLVRELQPAAVSYSFNLPAGPYLITVCSDAVTEGRTFKVAVGH